MVASWEVLGMVVSWEVLGMAVAWGGPGDGGVGCPMDDSRRSPPPTDARRPVEAQHLSRTA